MDYVLQQKRACILNVVRQILKTRYNVLVEDLALHFLRKKKTVVIKDSEREDFEAICKTIWNCHKPNCAYWIKQSDEFIARLSTCKPGNSRLLKQWVSSCSQTKGFLWGKCGSYLALSADWLLRGLLPYLDQGGWVMGTMKSRDGVNRLGSWEFAGALFWLLRRAVNYCKDRLTFLYEPKWTFSVLSLT